MPVPRPGAKETQDAFHARCMGWMNENDPERGDKQMNAICATQWDRKDTQESARLVAAADLEITARHTALNERLDQVRAACDNVAQLVTAAGAAAASNETGDAGGGERAALGESLHALRAGTLALARLEEALSHDATRELLSQTLQADLGGSGATRRWVWVREVYDDRVVYEVDPSDGPGPGELYQRSYAIDDGTQKVTLGDPVKVKVATTYVVAEAAGAAPPAPPTPPAPAPAAPPSVVHEHAANDATAIAGDLVPLVERAVRKDGTVPLKLISPGWGTTGYYPPNVLERDGPKVFTRGLKTYIDHPTDQEERDRPERSLRDLAGELVSDAQYLAEGPEGPGLYADAKVFSPFREHLDELAPHIGISIRGLGRVNPQGEAEGRKGPIVETISVARSADYVTAGGAGGKVLQLLEAARGVGRSGPGGPPTPTERDTDMDDLEEAQRQLREARSESSTLRASLEEIRTKLAESEQRASEVGRIKERLLLRDAADMARRHLATSDLHAATVERLVREATAHAPVGKDGEIDEPAFITQLTEAVRDHTAYLAQVHEAGRVHGMGAPTASDDIGASQTRLGTALGRLGLGEAGVKVAVGGRA